MLDLIQHLAGGGSFRWRQYFNNATARTRFRIVVRNDTKAICRVPAVKSNR